MWHPCFFFFFCQSMTKPLEQFDMVANPWRSAYTAANVAPVIVNTILGLSICLCSTSCLVHCFHLFSNRLLSFTLSAISSISCTKGDSLFTTSPHLNQQFGSNYHKFHAHRGGSRFGCWRWITAAVSMVAILCRDMQLSILICLICRSSDNLFPA